jgi:hypothetical protein
LNDRSFPPPPGTDRLTELLQPLPIGDFLSTYWRRHHFSCKGAAGRFSGLLSWPELNRLLEHHWREPFRFRLTMQGRDLDPASYVDSEGTTPRVLAKELTGHLRSGATLAFNGVDELHEPLTRLAEAFESVFEAGTHMNVYAGWRSLAGLGVHRDDQDVFILQLEGRKHWQLHGFDFAGADAPPGTGSGMSPSAGFDEVLESGDLLYIPMGCYHVAAPMNEPTLHLTISVKSSPKSRPSFSLPWSATAEGLPPPGIDFSIRLKLPPPQPVAGGENAATSEWQGRGHGYRFPRAMRAIIEALADGRPRAVQDVVEIAAGSLDEEAVRVLVAMLVRLDLAVIDSRPPPPSG